MEDRPILTGWLRPLSQSFRDVDGVMRRARIWVDFGRSRWGDFGGSPGVFEGSTRGFGGVDFGGFVHLTRAREDVDDWDCGSLRWDLTPFRMMISKPGNSMNPRPGRSIGEPRTNCDGLARDASIVNTSRITKTIRAQHRRTKREASGRCGVWTRTATYRKNRRSPRHTGQRSRGHRQTRSDGRDAGPKGRCLPVRLRRRPYASLMPAGRSRWSVARRSGPASRRSS